MILKTKRDLSSLTPGNGVQATPQTPKTPQVRTESLLARKYVSDVIAREKHKYMGQIANSNILGKPGESLIIYITRIGPDSLVENRPAWVEFNVWNRASGKEMTNIYVRVRVKAWQSLDDYEGFFNFPLNKLSPGESIDGAISFVLPRADKDNVVTVEICQLALNPYGEINNQVVQVLASDQSTFDVAARFSIHMSDITIRDTASIINDTVTVLFQGLSESGFWEDSAALGDQNNTSGLSPEVLPVGPFDMVPGSNKTIAATCTIYNAGHSSDDEDAKNILSAISSGSAKTTTGVFNAVVPQGSGGWGQISGGVDGLFQAAIAFFGRNCDTVVLHDSKLITEQSLFDNTLDENDNSFQTAPLAEYIMRMPKKAGVQLIPDVLGGGCRDSDYETGLFFQRHRVPEMLHDTSIDGMHVSPGQRVNFGLKGLIPEKIRYNPDGAMINIQPNGLYEAPKVITPKKFDIVKWTVMYYGKKGLYPAYTDFCVVLLD